MGDMVNLKDDILSDPLFRSTKPLSFEEACSFIKDASNLMEEMDEFPLVEIGNGGKNGTMLIFAGDLHGDLGTTCKLVSYFSKRHGSAVEKGEECKLILLGDYLDRAPESVPQGGLRTFLYVMAAKMRYPEDVILLRGNHESSPLMSFSPYELPIECKELFGIEDGPLLQGILEELFSSLPLAVRTGSGIAAVHASFPKKCILSRDMVRKEDGDKILQFLWGDPKEAGMWRGPISDRTNFSKRDLELFLTNSDCNIMLRGHTPQLSGVSMCNAKLLTLTSFMNSQYESVENGVIVETKMEEGKKVGSVNDLEIIHLDLIFE